MVALGRATPWAAWSWSPTASSSPPTGSRSSTRIAEWSAWWVGWASQYYARVGAYAKIFIIDLGKQYPELRLDALTPCITLSMCHTDS